MLSLVKSFISNFHQYQRKVSKPRFYSDLSQAFYRVLKTPTLLRREGKKGLGTTVLGDFLSVSHFFSLRAVFVLSERHGSPRGRVKT